nr:DUF2971 domain-containing protein [Vibrio crassostreae]
MWSHYADHHKGFVVEFDVNLSNEKLVKEPEFYFGGNDVEYSHEMPVKVIGTTNFSDIYRQFLVKSEDWAYEQEYRVLSTNKGAGIHEFDHTMISAVIFGAKMSIENMNKLKDEVSIFSHKFKHSVSIIKAKVAPDKYALEFENIT